MAIVTTVKAPEQFIVDVNGDYSVCFESIPVTVAAALPSGTVLKDAATVAAAADTVLRASWFPQHNVISDSQHRPSFEFDQRMSCLCHQLI